jgi:hypothetical protein
MTFRSALFVAHPGHELRLHHWMECERPIVYILTDGSGHGEHRRTPESREVLERCGAQAGSIFGRFADRDLYEILLHQDVAPIAGLVRELARELGSIEAQVVAGDAFELYSPAHDLARVVLDLAVAQSGRKIENYEIGGGDVTLALDDAALSRKLASIEAYESMRAEVENVLRQEGMEALRIERLSRAREPWSPQGPAMYERYGADRVAAGHYRTVIRYHEHFAPFVTALTEALQPALA